MQRTFILAPLLAGALALAAIAPADSASASPRVHTAPKPTIAAIVASSGGTFDNDHIDFDILLRAVQATDLAGSLNDPTVKLTVFAPNDAAFIRTARDLGYTGHDEQGTWNFLVSTLTTLGNGDPIPVLKNILLYHVAPGSLRPTQVLASTSIDTLLGQPFGVHGIELIDAARRIRNPKLDLGAINIEASNGRIHTITRVLIPVAL